MDRLEGVGKKLSDQCIPQMHLLRKITYGEFSLSEFIKGMLKKILLHFRHIREVDELKKSLVQKLPEPETQDSLFNFFLRFQTSGFFKCTESMCLCMSVF